MELSRAQNVGQSLAFAIASLGLGAYLASGTSHLTTQVLMFSFPPASLWVATRRAQRAQVIKSHHPADDAIFEELTTGLDFDILTKAS